MTNLMMMIGGCVVLMAIIGLAVYFIKKQGKGKSMENLALILNYWVIFAPQN